VPDVVDKAGVVPPSAVPQYQRDIYGQVKDRGPGPHVLTGPIEIPASPLVHAVAFDRKNYPLPAGAIRVDTTPW